MILDVHPSLLSWITDYLDSHTQCTVSEGVSSGVLSVPSGVPQGRGQCWVRCYLLFMLMTCQLFLLAILPLSYLLTTIVCTDRCLILMTLKRYRMTSMLLVAGLLKTIFA